MHTSDISSLSGVAFTLAFMSAAAASAPAAAAPGVVPVPAIPSGAPSAVFKVKVNGTDVAVNDESGPDFHTAAFCMDRPVTIEITTPEPAKTCVVRPLRHKIEPTTTRDGTLTFMVGRPLKLVVKIGEYPNLALLATPPEHHVPKPSVPNVMIGVQSAGGSAKN